MIENSEHSNLHTSEKEPIAIIGIGCRFPGGANSPESFWKLLRDGVDTITQVPADRWNLNSFYDPDPTEPGKIYTRWGGFIDQIDQFDATFFKISSREAARMDPQQRLLLEVAWEALEDGGQVPERLAGTNTGVFVGTMFHDYGDMQVSVSDRKLIDAHTVGGAIMSIAANRISYVFDFTGPSMAVDTACSSSLVAVHLACQSIWNGECTLALAAGVNALLKPEMNIAISKASLLSADGRCKSFDAQADGYVRAEGAGTVVLKPLSSALADGDPIYALILASVVTQDGHKNSIGAPEVLAQEAALRKAYRQAGVSPEQVQYVEAHGTGTFTGDPIEANAVGTVVGSNRPPGNYCIIGSVKSNIGHLESAAGIAGLIKAVLSLKHHQIPPNLHFHTPNPKIPFEELRLRVPQTLETWPDNGNCPRIAGVNSFGFGGTNAHVVLQGAQTVNRTSIPQPLDAIANDTGSAAGRGRLVPLSARSPEALQALARAYLDFLTAQESSCSVSLSDISYTASQRRGHHDYRLALVIHSKKEMSEYLEAFLAGETRRSMSSGRLVLARSPKLAFVFSGMGAQWWAMGRCLLEQEPVFREVIEQCDRLSRQYTSWSLWEELTANEERSRIGEVEIAQLANFVLQVALAALWRSWGIYPDALVGHSGGEVAAAHVAGVLSLEDAIRVIFHRGHLQQKTSGLAQVFAVGLSLEEALQGINPQPATIPLFSTVTGQAVLGSELDAAYWGENMRNPVRFSAAIDELIQAGHNLFIEISPHPVLADSISECVAKAGSQGMVLPSLRHREPERDTMLESLGKLYTLGYPVDWKQLDQQGGRFVRLPSYPWQRERYWQESEESQQDRVGQPGSYRRTMLKQQVHPLLGCRLEAAHPVWDVEIDQQRLAYLYDHRVQGAVVYAGAAYVEMALAAARETFGDVPTIVEELKFQKALFLPDDELQRLQLLFEPKENCFEVYSLTQGTDPSWVQHVTGKLNRLKDSRASKLGVLEEIRLRCRQEISKSDFYRQSYNLGYQPGPYFQGIERLWSGEAEALGQILFPDVETEVEDYLLHPVILDSAIQVLLSTISIEKNYMAVQIDRLRFYRRPGLQLWSHARLVEQSATRVKGDIQLLDQTGNVLVEIQGLQLHSLEVARHVVPEKMDDYLYEYQWALKARPSQALVRRSANFTASPLQIAESVQLTAESLSEKLRRKQYYDAVEPQINVLCAEYVLKALQLLGCEWVLHQRFCTATLAQQLGVASQHWRLLGRMLEILQNEGVLSQVYDQWEVCQIPEVKAPQETWKALIAQCPAYQAELTLLERCGQQLAEVLRGEVEPLNLIFPQGSLTTSEHLYYDSPTFRIYNLLVQKAIATVLKHAPEGRTIRILEIGAGTGGMTSYLLPVLSAQKTEYVFTDVSQLFTAQAAQKFRDYPFVQYQFLDIEGDPVAQGFEAHSFDVILASNVLHATRDLRQTLEKVKQLLASEGLLVPLELTNSPLWVDLVFGLLKGWWLFSDLDLRPKQPLLSLQKWREVLKEVGFTEVASIGDLERGDESLQSVILAQGPCVQQQLETLDETSLLRSTLSLPEKGSWLIFADSPGGTLAGVGQQLAELLKERQENSILISPGTAFKRINANHFQICPEQREDMQQLLEAALTDQPPCRGIVHLWSLDALPPEETTVSSLESAQILGCVSVLHLVQALAKVDWSNSPRLWLVNRGTQTVGGSSKSVSIAQSPLWGLSRVIVNEHPALRCTMVDLSPANSSKEIESLFEEFWSDDEEDEIALRGEARYVHRLMRIPGLDVQATAHLIQNPPSQVPNQYQPFCLDPTAGVLDQLKLRATTRREPGTGELEIQVCATGLNFKDVAKATSWLAEPNLEGTFSGRSLGIECAGKIAAIGEGVEGFQIGDEVIALAPNSFSTYTTTDARFVVPKPTDLSFEEAATIPFVFLTAYYTLHHLGRISKGDRVLIHAGADSMGLAAIQLAQRAGAEILATADNLEKQEFIRALGVQHVMDSPSSAFADEVMTSTGGKGVDIVLNSLAGEARSSSISVLGAYGRFIQIGADNENSKLGLHLPHNLSFFAVDLDRLLRERPDFAGSLWREVMALFADGTLHPLPHRVFSISKMVSALRCMEEAKHIGKIVVSVQDEEVLVAPASEQSTTFRFDGTYLITDGLGEFGLNVAQWMVEYGARHLVLIEGNAAIAPAAKSAIEAMKQAGAEVVVAKVDVTHSQQVKSVLAEIRQSMPPLRGIIHATRVVDDAVLLEMNQQRFQKVMAPKVIGAWNLHSQTLNTQLDFFVLFSSAMNLIGNRGQGNYVAGDAFLEALAYHRHAQGLPALSVNFDYQDNIDQNLAECGIKPLSWPQLLKTLGELLQLKRVQTGVVDLDWQQWAKIHAAGASPRLSHLVGKVAPGQAQADDGEKEGNSLSKTILATEPAQRQQLLESRIREQVARVLGTSASKLDIEQPLTALGLDSLMAIELRNRLNNELGMDVPTMNLMGGSSIAELAGLLLEQLTLTSMIPSVPPSPNLSEDMEEITL